MSDATIHPIRFVLSDMDGTLLRPDHTPSQRTIDTVRALRDAFGALPDLSEQTADGPIPRTAATGLTPFAAYARPVGAAATSGKPMIADRKSVV